MIYTQLYLKNRFRVPTILTLIFILALILFFTRFLTSNSLPSRAVNKTLRRVEVVNLSPSQATVYWQTDTKEIGWIISGEQEDQLTRVYLDERDISNKKNPYLNHFVIIRNLKENRQYYFKIVSNNQLVNNINGRPFSFTTPSDNQVTANLSPAYGKVIKKNSQPLDNGVVIINPGNNRILAALTKTTGEWLIPINNSIINTPNQSITIDIISEDNEISNVITDFNQLSPLPQTVIIGNNYNFIANAPDVLSVQNISPSNKVKPIDIIYPVENALIPGYSPLIKGVSLPNTQVEIIVNSAKTYSANVTSDKVGNWSYTLPAKLELGKHTITVKSKDEKGSLVTIVRQFTIIGDEGGDARVLGVADNEPVISGAPTPSVTLSPTITPTLPAYPLTPTIEDTASPTPPVSGTSFIMPVIGGAALVIVGIGIILAF